MNVLQRLSETMADLLRFDGRRVVLGEDAADGGMLGLSRACLEDDRLRGRVIATPLTPAATVAHAAGIARAGRRPILVFASPLGLLEGLAGLREVARLGWRTDPEHPVTLLMVAPCGPGFGLGGDAGDGLDATLARVPGLRVLCAGRAHEAQAWLRAAADFEHGQAPTVLLLPRRLLLSDDGDDDTADLGRACTSAARVRDGHEATVFAWGETLDVAHAAVALSQIDAAIVDVGCLAPLDTQTLVAEAKATGKIVIAHAGPAAGGLGGELAALFADEAILHLDAPITRVTGLAGPLGHADEALAVPSVASVAEAITRVARY
jgi:pyruvate/2-oxoglutarate/acetoin dehydrogenase E1 component